MAIIRRFNREDLEKVERIADISLKEEYTRELYISIHKFWRDGFLVHEMSGEVTGFICGMKEDAKTARVLMLAVHPFYRNQGIGSNLLENFIEVSSSSGANKITLEVRVGNQRTINFYKRRGFQMVSRLDDFYTNGEAGYKMVRYL